jgi:hypothetical protein
MFGLEQILHPQAIADAIPANAVQFEGSGAPPVISFAIRHRHLILGLESRTYSRTKQELVHESWDTGYGPVILCFREMS